MKFTITRKLPQRPARPEDRSHLFKPGSPAHDQARREFLRDMRHYQNDMRQYRKECAAQRQGDLFDEQ